MTLEHWKTGSFSLPGLRPGTVLTGVDGGCPTHHTCLETLNQASDDDVGELHRAMVQADVALFTALSHYWNGIARILQAELEDDEREGLKDAAGSFERALEQIDAVQEHESRIFAIAEPIQYSAYLSLIHI